eukprot:CAMPEP_0172479778 /NCGR_PEP_ID=MMETSP1066-20121228/4595_1 /TAXON_ID=671091 /ORGANISM="Coscinodiscus wailesii, Strain CCMP2513" /LENGTH=49 /DNA_ID=CAMNT_0013240547 /DNA_START=72 /DNA_END=221 /DNA_ORIENTATION=+
MAFDSVPGKELAGGFVTPVDATLRFVAALTLFRRRSRSKFRPRFVCSSV